MECQVKKSQDIPETIAKAFYIAKTGRPGPVLVDITKGCPDSKNSTLNIENVII